MLGDASPAVLFTEPRFTGAGQASLGDRRTLTHKSSAPMPPCRADAKYSARPSAERLGPPSKLVVLIVGPRFTGAPNTNERSWEFAGPRIKSATSTSPIATAPFSI